VKSCFTKNTDVCGGKRKQEIVCLILNFYSNSRKEYFKFFLVITSISNFKIVPFSYRLVIIWVGISLTSTIPMHLSVINILLLIFNIESYDWILIDPFCLSINIHFLILINLLLLGKPRWSSQLLQWKLLIVITVNVISCLLCS
jgi:hypothetical protein